MHKEYNTVTLKNYSIVKDTFIVSLKANQMFLDNSTKYISLVNTKQSSLKFKQKELKEKSYHYKVFKEGTLIGTLIFKIRKNHRLYPTFKFYNYLLYSTSDELLIQYLQEISSCLGFEIWSISNLEIAIDSNTSFFDTISDLLNNKKYSGGIWEKIFKNESSKSLFTIANKYIGIRTYDKSEEILKKSTDEEIPNKSYISEYWKANNFPENAINRFEIILKNRYFRSKKIKGIDGMKSFLDSLDLMVNKFFNDNLKIINDEGKTVPLFILNGASYKRAKNIRLKETKHFTENYLKTFMLNLKALVFHYYLDTEDETVFSIIKLLKEKGELEPALIEHFKRKHKAEINEERLDRIKSVETLSDEKNKVKIKIPKINSNLIMNSFQSKIQIKIRDVKSNLHSENGGCIRFHYLYH